MSCSETNRPPRTRLRMKTSRIPKISHFGVVHHHHRKRGLLSRLEQRQYLEALVESAETAGKERDRRRFLQEKELSGEEVAEGHELVVTPDGLVRLLLERELDVDPEAQVPPGASVGRSHDAASGAGDDHPSRLGHPPSELDGARVVRVLGARPGGAEDRYLPRVAEGSEDFERVAHFLQRGVGDLQVHPLGTVNPELESGRRDLLYVGALGLGATGLDELREASIELGVAGGVSVVARTFTHRQPYRTTGEAAIALFPDPLPAHIAKGLSR